MMKSNSQAPVTVPNKRVATSEQSENSNPPIVID